MSAPDKSVVSVERIRADHIHGASWLAREAARSLAAAATQPGEAAERLAATHALARELALARPAMAAIANTVSAIWAAAEAQASDPVARLAALQAEARVMEAGWAGAVGAMVDWTRRRLASEHGAVYTLSRSGTVEGVLTTLAREQAGQDPLAVIVSESRPGGEGVGLARALAGAGALVTLAPDTASAALMEGAALVLVGADAILADGSLVNKAGTRLLALAAHDVDVPVYALAERLKITPPNYPLALGEEAPEPLLPSPAAGLVERRPLFERVPGELVAGVVAEDGLLSGPDIARLASEAAQAYAALMRP